MGLTDKLQVARDAAASGESPEAAMDLFQLVTAQTEAVAQVLPVGMDAARFIRMVHAELERTPRLLGCDPGSVLGAVMLAAQTGLEPGGPLGQSYLIPQPTRSRGWVAEFQIGYKGYITLAARSGITVVARTVRLDDQFDWQYGTEEYIRHRPAIDSTSLACNWYAVGKFADGRPPAFVVIDRTVADRAREASSRSQRGPWNSNYDEMALKTGILRLKNLLPLSTDVALAMSVDGAVVQDPAATVEAVAAAMPLDIPDDDPEVDAEADADPTAKATDTDPTSEADPS